MAIDLTGVSVLVTRASHQAENLCRLIAVAGGEPVRFPVTEITSLPLGDAAVAAALEQVPAVDIVIFVSPQCGAICLGLARAPRLATTLRGTSAGCWPWYSPPVDGPRNCGQRRAGRVL